MMLHAQFEWQPKFSSLERHMIVVPQSPSLNVYQAPSESPWTLDLGCHMSPQQLGGIDTCGPGVHTSWSCLLPHVQQLLVLWLLFDSVIGKKCRHMWHPTPDTFPAPREPWSSHQGTSHLLHVTHNAPAERGFLQL